MAMGGESSTSVDMSQVLQIIAALTSAVDARLSTLKRSCCRTGAESGERPLVQENQAGEESRI